MSETGASSASSETLPVHATALGVPQLTGSLASGRLPPRACHEPPPHPGGALLDEDMPAPATTGADAHCRRSVGNDLRATGAVRCAARHDAAESSAANGRVETPQSARQSATELDSDAGAAGHCDSGAVAGPGAAASGRDEGDVVIDDGVAVGNGLSSGSGSAGVMHGPPDPLSARTGPESMRTLHRPSDGDGASPGYRTPPENDAAAAAPDRACLITLGAGISPSGLTPLVEPQQHSITPRELMSLSELTPLSKPQQHPVSPRTPVSPRELTTLSEPHQHPASPGAPVSPSELTPLSEVTVQFGGNTDWAEVREESSLMRRPRFLVWPTRNGSLLKNGTHAAVHRPETRLAPPDGGWGWVALGGSVVVNILIPGFIKSFGVLFDDVAAQFDATPAAVAWIPALSFFMYNFMGLVGGALCQQYSCRVTATLGGLLASAGLLISYFANHIYYLYVGLGLVTGCGGCFAYSSGVLMVGSYFERRRGLANGLCVSGSALGAMIFPPALDLLLDSSGFSNTMLLLCGVLLHVVPCAALYQPVEWHMVPVPVSPPADGPEPSPPPPVISRSATPLLATTRRPLSAAFLSPVDSLSSRDSIHSLYYLSTVLHGSSLAASQKRGSHQLIEAARRRRTASTCSPLERTSLPPPPPPPRRPLIELTLLWNPVFLLMIASSALFQVSVANLLVILPSYATHVGYSRQQASLLLSVFAGSDLVGRVGGAALSDLSLVPRRVFLLGAYLLCGGALAVLPAATSVLYGAACAAVALAGFGTGVVMGLYSVMLIEYLGLERLGSSYGLSVCLCGLTLLGGPPLVGLIRQATPSPHPVIYLLAVLPFLAAAAWLPMPAAQAHVRRTEAQAV